MNKALLVTVCGGAAAIAAAFALAVPSVAANDVFAGQGCAGSIVSRTGDQIVAQVAAGPWAVANASSVTMICTVSVGDDIVGNQGAPEEVSVAQTTAGSVGSLNRSVAVRQFDRDQPVYLCSAAQWTYADSTSSSVYTAPGQNPTCHVITEPTDPPTPTATPTATPTTGQCPPGYHGVVVTVGNLSPVMVCENVI